MSLLLWIIHRFCCQQLSFIPTTLVIPVKTFNSVFCGESKTKSVCMATVDTTVILIFHIQMLFGSILYTQLSIYCMSVFHRSVIVYDVSYGVPACMSVSRCGLLPMYPHSEGSDSPAAARAHRQTHLCCRWVEHSKKPNSFFMGAFSLYSFQLSTAYFPSPRSL